MNREQTIAAILKAARKPCPELVESRRLKGTDGKWYSWCGFPDGVHSTGEVRVDGFVCRDPDGTTYGRCFPTREAATAFHDAYEDKNAADFRNSMEQGTDERLAEQAEYWLKNLAPEEATL
jgi:hypothetical protein